MTKTIALLALLSLSVLNGLGQFWFVYGVWPRSWWAFVGFGLSNLVIWSLMSAVLKSDDD